MYAMALKFLHFWSDYVDQYGLEIFSFFLNGLFISVLFPLSTNQLLVLCLRKLIPSQLYISPVS